MGFISSITSSGAKKTIQPELIENMWKVASDSTFPLPFHSLIEFANDKFDFPDNPKISKEVKWQVFFAASSYQDANGLAHMNDHDYFSIEHLSIPDLVDLYKILYCYHQEGTSENKNLFNQHLFTIEAKFIQLALDPQNKDALVTALKSHHNENFDFVIGLLCLEGEELEKMKMELFQRYVPEAPRNYLYLNHMIASRQILDTYINNRLELDLSGLGLEKFPDSITYLSSLEILKLSNNLPSSLSKAIYIEPSARSSLSYRTSLEKTESVFVRYRPWFIALAVSLMITGVLGAVAGFPLFLILIPSADLSLGLALGSFLGGMFVFVPAGIFLMSHCEKVNLNKGHKMVSSGLNLDPEAVKIGQLYKIDEERKRQAPTPIDFSRFCEDVTSVDVTSLLSCFDEVLGTDSAQTNFFDVTTYMRSNYRFKIENLVNFVITRNSINHSSYYDQLEIIYKNIIVELQNPEVPIAKKYNVLKELSDSADKCAPRKLEEGLRQLRYIKNFEESIVDTILEWAQTFKEEIILQNFQGSQFHILNGAREQLKGKWGLEQSAARAEYDQYRNSFSSASVNVYDESLTEHYTPARFISFLSAKVEAQNQMSLVNAYAQDCYLEDKIDDDFLGKMYTTTGSGKNMHTVLSPMGAAYILESTGFLRRKLQIIT